MLAMVLSMDWSNARVPEPKPTSALSALNCFSCQSKTKHKIFKEVEQPFEATKTNQKCQSYRLMTIVTSKAQFYDIITTWVWILYLILLKSKTLPNHIYIFIGPCLDINKKCNRSQTKVFMAIITNSHSRKISGRFQDFFSNQDLFLTKCFCS